MVVALTTRRRFGWPKVLSPRFLRLIALVVVVFWAAPKTWRSSITEKSIENLDRLVSRQGRPNGLFYDAKKGHLLLPARLPRHPVRELIEHGKKEWADKVARQSRTLEQAVAEYMKRYGRNPPRGFDLWWNYAKENHVILKDEYDQINRDIEPYLALHSQTIRERTAKLAESKQTGTVAFLPDQDPPYAIEPFKARTKDLVDMLEPIIPSLPAAFNITISVHDGGYGRLAYDHEQHLRNLARTSQIVELGARRDGWKGSMNSSLAPTAKLCPPDSPMRSFTPDETNRPDYEQYRMPPLHSFIYKHKAAMDVCYSPELYWVHGAVRGKPDLQEAKPMFTWSKVFSHSDLTIVPLEQYRDDYGIDEPQWHEKKHGTLAWRGSLTGSSFVVGNEWSWKLSPRWRLHQVANAVSGSRSVLREKPNGSVDTVDKKVADLNRDYFNASVAGKPLQCDDETRELIQQTIAFAPKMDNSALFEHKYLLDVDGNGWSGRFHKLMRSNSLVFKASVFTEWWVERSQPWVHYVPVNPDYSDVYDIMAFFEGIKGGTRNEDLAEEMAKAGQEWARLHWRREDMIAFMWRMLLEVNRLYNRSDQESFDYGQDNDEAW
ncbi:glycosyltransferase family 90 protein [Mixia osmundae IAM 14324]|uniref:Glycosyl transferase CAP10 domain-containing protein n=1 Tax=Mixia osmundae (strain CBS 9802 / IAM 14324 / JCM 22182 / KY 12970) TaxID=764103 RepID=G7DVC5_MIXOS|nr:glycosyltransferase family 90 protein [Mixia osmundae IAM 14324]KEI42044.1 glycosyltransferase family 90 protein [Mixia osmundae IAM 14324]GAA94535.1 hypothetical protein E5Q_01187 [Mixia osmundae IAM 14324]